MKNSDLQPESTTKWEEKLTKDGSLPQLHGEPNDTIILNNTIDFPENNESISILNNPMDYPDENDTAIFANETMGLLFENDTQLESNETKNVSTKATLPPNTMGKFKFLNVSKATIYLFNFSTSIIYN